MAAGPPTASVSTLYTGSILKPSLQVIKQKRSEITPTPKGMGLNSAQPHETILRAGICVVGLRWGADVTRLCVCLSWFPALVPACVYRLTSASLCNTHTASGNSASTSIWVHACTQLYGMYTCRKTFWKSFTPEWTTPQYSRTGMECTGLETFIISLACGKREYALGTNARNRSAFTPWAKPC